MNNKKIELYIFKENVRFYHTSRNNYPPFYLSINLDKIIEKNIEYDGKEYGFFLDYLTGLDDRDLYVSESFLEDMKNVSPFRRLYVNMREDTELNNDIRRILSKIIKLLRYVPPRKKWEITSKIERWLDRLINVHIKKNQPAKLRIFKKP